MPVALRLLDLLPPDYQESGGQTNAPVPIQILTITGSTDEVEDLRNEGSAFLKLFRDARRFEFRSESPHHVDMLGLPASLLHS